jgi:hypothetical protein
MMPTLARKASWDLPSLGAGATSLLDVTVNGARAGDLATASLVSSTRFIELDAAVWSNNTVRVMARNISGATFDLAAATLSVRVVKRRVPRIGKRARHHRRRTRLRPYGRPYGGRPGGHQRVRRHPHHHHRSAPTCGVSDGPRFRVTG